MSEGTTFSLFSLVSFTIIFIYNLAAYNILKEAGKVEKISDLITKSNFELSCFIIKAMFGFIAVKNKLAIWVCRIIFFTFNIFLIIVYIYKFSY